MGERKVNGNTSVDLSPLLMLASSIDTATQLYLNGSETVSSVLNAILWLSSFMTFEVTLIVSARKLMTFDFWH